MKTAVILFNLGGPDSLSSVKPFLKNLFKDPAIITLPTIFRLPLASFIATRREKEAQEIYEYLGGKSPLLENTQEQADALESHLGEDFKCFICMRYWHPMTEEVVAQVKDYSPDKIILLPLYPQYSTTTTKSSVNEWKKICNKKGLLRPTHELSHYPTEQGFISAVTDLTQKAIAQHDMSTTRILFTAHGLPEKTVQAGDPYQREVEETVKAVVSKLNIKDLDYVTCYQSRVGPLEWIKPYTDKEIERAGEEGKDLIVVPVAFVSEHSETLVELDIEYKELAEEAGVKNYTRVPTVNTHPDFIQGLAQMITRVLGGQQSLCPRHRTGTDG